MALGDNDPHEIGGYALLDRLGAGGMGTVYLARAESGRPVALKIVHEQFAADPEFRTRFRQEIRAARRVSGAFTAPVVDADPDAPRPWMATTYVPGWTLRSRVDAQGPLSGAELRVLAVGLVEALRDMHQVRVIHRDLKPDNVLLTEDGPRVIDFGISRAADHQTLTVTGRILGTPPFMSPEQLETPHRVTPASDVFSLGAVLVYATTGRGPFDAGSPYMTAYNVVHEPPEVAELSGTVREIVQWCLAKEPGERPDPDDLLSAFREAPEEEWGARPAAPTAPSTLAVASTAPAARSRPRRGPVLVALATAVALLAGTGAYVWWPDGTAGGATPKADGPSVTPSTSRSPQAGSQAGSVPEASVLAADTAYTPVYGGDPGTTHAYADSPARRPTGWRAWNHAAGLGACVFVDASLVCVAPHEVDAKARLVRVDAATGRTMWSVPVVVHENGTPAVVGGTIAVSSPGGLRAFALADGRALWALAGEDTIGRVTSAGGNFYGTTFEGTVVSLAAATGEVRWRRPRVVEGIGYPRVRISGDRVHALTMSGGGTEAGHVVSLRASDGSTATTTALEKPCEPRDLTVLPLRGTEGPFFFCRLAESHGLLLQRSGAKHPDLDVPNGISTVTFSDRGMYGVITAQRPDHSFAQLDDGGGGGPLWQLPLGLACGAENPPPVVTGQRAYVICGAAGVVIDLTRHALAARFVLPAGARETGTGDAGVLVAGGVLFVQTERGWVSLDPYATPV
ncbi:protein kinase domain-containing protein [Streptomyces sp. NPDC055103]